MMLRSNCPIVNSTHSNWFGKTGHFWNTTIFNVCFRCYSRRIFGTKTLCAAHFCKQYTFYQSLQKGPFPSRFMNHVIDIYSAANEYMRNQNIQLLQVVVNAWMRDVQCFCNLSWRVRWIWLTILLFRCYRHRLASLNEKRRWGQNHQRGIFVKHRWHSRSCVALSP